MNRQLLIGLLIASSGFLGCSPRETEGRAVTSEGSAYPIGKWGLVAEASSVVLVLADDAGGTYRGIPIHWRMADDHIIFVEARASKKEFADGAITGAIGQSGSSARVFVFDPTFDVISEIVPINGKGHLSVQVLARR